MGFPHEEVPDGEVFAPHHYVYGLLLALVPVFVVWDDYTSAEPVFVLVAIGVGLFGFLFVWPFYPQTGALMSLLGPTLGLILVVVGWHLYPIEAALWVVALILFALDDAVEHAFGVPTPFDWLWKRFLVGRIN